MAVLASSDAANLAGEGVSGRVVIVTGASRGIGATLAEELARLGAKVACVARGMRRSPIAGRGSLEETVSRIQAKGGDAIAVSADLADEAEVVAMVDHVARHFGRLDMLVNNAAVLLNVTDLFSDLAAMDHEMNVNLRGPLVAMRAAVPHMRRTGEGRILNVSSSVALNVLPTMMTYGISKLALERLSIDVAHQLRGARIACNVFRIDVPVHNSLSDDRGPGSAIRPFTEPELTAAEGMIWVLAQPVTHTGRLESIHNLRRREGIMPQRAEKPFSPDILPFEKASLRWEW